MADDVEKEFTEAEAMVRAAMEREEDARNSDKFMIWYVYRHLLDANLNNFNEFRELPASETLTRSRRKIQNDENELLPTDPEVLMKRKLKAENVREYFSDKTDVLKGYEERLFKKQLNDLEDEEK